MSKDDIRKIIINKRNKLTESDIKSKSASITDKLKTLLEYNNSKVVLCYASINSEVQTLEIIQDCLLNNRTIALPKVKNDGQMDFHVIKSLNDLSPGYEGILEPKDNLLDISLIKDAMMLVPGTVFSKNCYRMGYGKGYYDRFIEKYKPRMKIGLAYEMQIIDDIDINEHDQKLDMVITEENIYK